MLVLRAYSEIIKDTRLQPQLHPQAVAGGTIFVQYYAGKVVLLPSREI